LIDMLALFAIAVPKEALIERALKTENHRGHREARRPSVNQSFPRRRSFHE
jgi:hypothetical protein